MLKIFLNNVEMAASYFQCFLIALKICQEGRFWHKNERGVDFEDQSCKRCMVKVMHGIQGCTGYTRFYRVYKTSIQGVQGIQGCKGYIYKGIQWCTGYTRFYRVYKG